MLIAEEPIVGPTGIERAVSMNDAVVAHLDKSHITVRTYPEKHPDSGISTFRVDIDVSTCGRISPLRALNHLIHSFESDIVITDYRVRGFTRDVRGVKHFIDHKIGSIQDFIERGILNRYQAIDVNVYQENIFHTKMMLKEFKLDDYLFAVSEDDLTGNEKRTVTQRLKREMAEIFYGTKVGTVTVRPVSTLAGLPEPEAVWPLTTPSVSTTFRTTVGGSSTPSGESL